MLESKEGFWLHERPFKLDKYREPETLSVKKKKKGQRADLVLSGWFLFPVIKNNKKKPSKRGRCVTCCRSSVRNASLFTSLEALICLPLTRWNNNNRNRSPHRHLVTQPFICRRVGICLFIVRQRVNQLEKNKINPKTFFFHMKSLCERENHMRGATWRNYRLRTTCWSDAAWRGAPSPAGELATARRHSRITDRCSQRPPVAAHWRVDWSDRSSQPSDSVSSNLKLEVAFGSLERDARARLKPRQFVLPLGSYRLRQTETR